MTTLDLPREHALAQLERMVLIRRFEEKCAEVYAAGKIRGFLHLYVGEEAIAVGAMAALRPTDHVVATYREHGQAILRGVTPGAVMAEMFGKANGCSRGRGGSMHLFSAEHRLHGGQAIVGGGLPVAVGLGLAQKLSGGDDLAVCFFGEGATDEGEFHESLNLASLWKLPVLFLCENNLYAMGTALERHKPVLDLTRVPAAHGLRSEHVDGMDVVAVERAVKYAADLVREGNGPRFLELRTYRFRAHSMYDAEKYRSKEEVATWRERDPILLFSARLREAGWLDDAALAAVEERVAAEVARAVEEAEAGPLEPVEDLERDVCVRPAPPGPRAAPAAAANVVKTTYREAIRAALRRAMTADPRVFLMGEDVGRYGGAYAVSGGLLAELGEERVRDTPLAESGFVGAGVGAALGGLRPIVEVMTVNFSLLALDQIVNGAATFRHMSGGQLAVPLVIRMATGGGRQLAAQHSHSLENWYAHVPGLKVLAPGTAQDAHDAVLAALADPDPVIVFEHQVLYPAEGELDDAIDPEQVWRAKVRRPGRDLSIVTYGGSVPKALAAAEALAAEGVEAEVLDLRCLRPLDVDAIVATVARTHRVVVVDEGWKTGSLAGELVATIVERAFFELDAPPARVCSVEVPIPYAKHLEDAALPSVPRIVEAAKGLLGRRG